MRLKLTGFNPLHPTDDSQVVELESTTISGKESAMTGDRKNYTIIFAAGNEYQVKETVAEIDDMIDQAGNQ